MRRILAVVGLLLLAVVAVASVFLALGHIAVRRQGDPIPPVEAVVAVPPGPARIAWIDTARQPMARSIVLAPSRDPDPDALYTMSHPSFVLEWPDGRILLVDAGMTREQALDFGRLLEMLGDAKPMEPMISTRDALGPAVSRIAGVIFTHLHEDHVGGLTALCNGGPPTIPVFVNEAQVDHPNWTTRGALGAITDTPCAQMTHVPAAEGSLRPLPGFPGVAVFHAGGHTPGSQVIVANVQGRHVVLAGDLANAIDGIRWDIPKPFLYSLLIVPEATGRLHDLRVWLRGLAEREAVEVLIAHDAAALRRSGIPEWTTPAS